MLSLEKFDEYLDMVSNTIKEYQRDISTGRVVPKTSRNDIEKLLFEELPVEGLSANDVIKQFKDKVIPNSTKVGSSRFLSWIITSPSQAGILGEIANIGISQAPFNFTAGPAATVVEEMVISWMAQLFGYGKESGGILVSGGSISTLTALGAAREAFLPGSAQDGIQAVSKPLTLYTSQKAHSSIDKAVGVMGIGKKMLRKVAVDDDFRIDVQDLEGRIENDIKNSFRPFCIIAQAGTSLCGAVDDIEALSGIAKKYGIWLHVDGAYGGGAILSKRGRELLKGIEKADSISVDPHKWFFVPAEAGCVLVKERRHLYNAYSTGIAEFDADAPINYIDYGIQSTRTSRAIKTWFALKTYGIRKLSQVVDVNMDNAYYFAGEIGKMDGVRLLNRPQTSAVCFSFGSASENMEFLSEIEEEFFISPASLKGEHCLRACFSNYRTTIEEVDLLLSMIRRFAAGD
ncbi:aromatic-L-amino-acid decarboxylase [Peptoclostridium litorale DSM 5388]|uniref:L-2,4-diaminobutyrate decarboxylase Ddc n=1 Tax=Peptoclostridium litorale DSM 5388 TaxID=1121324 RepID=A0A069RI51_PEPLI|nr:aminotransferase class I/II-fold pyridoxal phosphate-dependent enzyme [Peptoclostridium litorale]KDR96666.1 L-2,4-diaminobutyrate decarboxylase Ddc [Peptoclostridium litorale DSM 5388]SIN67924.1 aromatic-L-amino-acid decarboxylase [Peptoclostridium litorale DSM 5388]